jgi:hypothetical protein
MMLKKSLKFDPIEVLNSKGRTSPTLEYDEYVRWSSWFSCRKWLARYTSLRLSPTSARGFHPEKYMPK